MSSSSNKKTLLNDSRDWKAWNREFKNRADATFIWEKIDPEADQRLPFLKMPTEPDPRQYEKRLLPDQQPPANSTRNASAQAASEEQPDPRGQPANAGEMTTAGRAAYQLDRAVYSDKMKDFREEAKAIKEIKLWIDDTVNKHLLSTACPPGKTLDVWYRQLKERVGASDRQIYHNAAERYENSLWKTSSKIPKDLQAWLSEWEDAINEAADEEIPGVQHSRDWWWQFDKAVTRFGFKMWALAYRGDHEKDIENNALTIRRVVNDFGEEINRDTEKSAKRAIQKGSHAAAFKGAQADKTPEPETSSSPSSKESSAIRATSRKRKNTEGTASGCRACGIPGHTLGNCYYAFPDQAYQKWKPSRGLKQKFADNLKNDSDLRKEIQRLKKKAKKVQFAESSSQEGQTTDIEDHK